MKSIPELLISSQIRAQPGMISLAWPGPHLLHNLSADISLVEYSYTLCTAQRDFYDIILRFFYGKRDTRRRLIVLFVSADGTQDQKPNS